MKRIVVLCFIFLFIPINCFSKIDSAQSSIVMDIDSGRILYSKKMNEKRLIASITKIMTCIITLENSNIEDKVVVGEEVLKMYGTNIYLELGEEISINDLLYGLMLRSGNDAAVVLANNVSSSEEDFVKLMNDKAKELGMTNTTFENPHGLDEDTKNYSTAYDMALLSRYAYNNNTYRKIIKTKKYVTKSSKKTYIWYNRMSLINNYEYCLGGKNGYTPKAGKTLVSVSKKDDLLLTTVTLDDSNIYENHKRLYDKCYDEYKKYEIISKDNFKVDKSLIKENLYLKESFSYPLKEDEIKSIYTFMSINSNNKNNRVGDITISLDNKVIGKVNVYKKVTKKEEKTLFQKYKELILRYSKKINRRSTK